MTPPRPPRPHRVQPPADTVPGGVPERVHFRASIGAVDAHPAPVQNTTRKRPTASTLLDADEGTGSTLPPPARRGTTPGGGGNKDR